MVARYEELRTAVTDGTGEGWQLGRGVLAAKGMAAWTAAWRSLPAPPARTAPGWRSPPATQAPATNWYGSWPRWPWPISTHPTNQQAQHPDASVQQAIQHLLATFAATGSAYACVKAFADEGLKFPRRIRTGPNKGELTWGILQHHRVLQVLHNPRYAGAFCYGRHAHSRGPGGKTTTRVLPRDQWTVLITDAHPGS